jgi:hypothetical protein
MSRQIPFLILLSIVLLYYGCKKKDTSNPAASGNQNCLLTKTVITGISEQDFQYDKSNRLVKTISGKDSSVYEYLSDGTLKISYTNLDSGKPLPAYVLLSFDQKGRVISAYDFLAAGSDVVQHRSMSCSYQETTRRIDISPNSTVINPGRGTHFILYLDANGNITHEQQFEDIDSLTSESFYTYDDKPNPQQTPNMLNFPESLFPPVNNVLIKTLHVFPQKQNSNKLVYQYTYSASGYPQTYTLNDSANASTEVGSFVYSCP